MIEENNFDWGHKVCDVEDGSKCWMVDKKEGKLCFKFFDRIDLLENVKK